MNNVYLDKLVGKDVAVIKTDGFVKTGFLLEHDANFIFLRFTDGKIVSINKNSIVELKEETK